MVLESVSRQLQVFRRGPYVRAPTIRASSAALHASREAFSSFHSSLKSSRSSRMHGRHSLKFGGDVKRWDRNFYQAESPFGRSWSYIRVTIRVARRRFWQAQGRSKSPAAEAGSDASPRIIYVYTTSRIRVKFAPFSDGWLPTRLLADGPEVRFAQRCPRPLSR